MRVIQPKGQRGSLKWIQLAVAHCPQILQPMSLPEIQWLSPRIDDDFAEYRDEAFLDLLGLSKMSASLREFWPKRGPQWDALGITEHGPVLVEAKAHVREFFSPGSQSRDSSRAKIDAAFHAVQQDLEINPSTNWSEVYYQYTNRLAFLWWLRKQGVNAELLFVSFLNDHDMGGPASPETWHGVFACANYALGIASRNKLRQHIHHTMPDINQISAASGG